MRSSGKLGIGGTALDSTGRFSAQIYLIANAGCWIRYYQPGSFALPLIPTFLMSPIDPKGQLSSFLQLAAALLDELDIQADGQAGHIAWMINALSVMGDCRKTS